MITRVLKDHFTVFWPWNQTHLLTHGSKVQCVEQLIIIAV